MSGAPLALGITAAAASLAVGFAATAGAAVAGQRLAAAADAAALAAADAASGAVSGAPCDRAVQVAETAGAVVEACDLDDLIATVTVSLRFAGLVATASARAGPPPWPE